MAVVTYYKALVVQQRDKDGVITAFRETETYYIDEDSARDSYGDRFYMLLTGDNYKLEIAKPNEIKTE